MEDDLDLLIIDITSSISSYLTHYKVAKKIIRYDMGYPYWNHKNLDFTLIQGYNYKKLKKVYNKKYSIIPNPPIDFDKFEKLTTENNDKINILKIFHDKNKLNICVPGRLAKINIEFLKFIEKILKNEKIKVIFIGEGSKNIINENISEKCKERVLILNENISLKTLALYCDVILDTFSFHSGMTAQYLQFYKKPILSYVDIDLKNVFENYRLEELVFNDLNEMIKCINNLSIDKNLLKDLGELSSRKMKKVNENILSQIVKYFNDEGFLKKNDWDS